MFEGGQISEGGGDKFPRKFGPGATNFAGNLARGGQIFGGDIFPVTLGRGLQVSHGYLHPGKCEHSEV